MHKMGFHHFGCLLIGILLIMHSSSLVPNRKTPIVKEPIGMDLSENQRYLMAYNKTHFGVYNAIFGTKIELISPNANIQSAAFSQNGLKVAISNSEGQVSIYSISNNENKQSVVFESKFGQKVDKQIEGSNPIAGFCFSAKDESLIIVYTDGIIVSSSKGQAIIGAVNQGMPTHVACGTGSNLGVFAVAGLTSDSSHVFVKIFKVDSQKQQIQQQQINFDTKGWMKINSIEISSSPLGVYISGNSDQILSYLAPQYQPEVFFKGVGEDQYKFKISNSGFFAVSNATHIVVVSPEKQNLQNKIEYIQSDSKVFALSATGARITYINKQGEGIFASECNEGQYYNTLTKSCQVCSSSCSLCASDSTTCFQCKGANYLESTQCLKCKDNCLQCTSGLNCQECSQGLVLTEQECSCKLGYTLIDNACHRGIQFWVMASVVGGACFAFFLIAVLCVVRSRLQQSKKERLLEEAAVQHS